MFDHPPPSTAPVVEAPSPDGGRGFYLRAVSYFRPDWRRVVLLFALIGLSIAIGLLQSWPLAVIIDAVLTTDPRQTWVHRLFLAPLPKGDRLGQVIGIALIGMGLKVAQDALTWARTIVNNRVNNDGVRRLRDELFGKLAGRADGDAMYRLVNDAQGPQVILNVLVGAAVALLTFVTTAAIMFSRSVPLTLYALSVAPLLVLINLRYGRVIRRRTTEAKEVEAGMVSLVGERPRDPGDFARSSRRVADAWLDLNRAQEAYWFLVRTVFSVGGAVVFGYGGYLAWRDQFAHPVQDGMTVGTLAVFMDYLGKLWDPLTRLTGAAADIQPGVAGTRRVFEVLDQHD